MMNDQLNLLKENFVYPKSYYHGESFPEGFLLNANLQEFAQKVNYIVGLHSNGKISTEEAYSEIEKLWQKFKEIKNETKSYL